MFRPRRPRFPEGDVVPWRGLTFVVASGGVTAGLTLATGRNVVFEPETLRAFAILATLAAITDLFTVRGVRNTVYDTAAVFLVAAAVLLPPGLAVLAVVPACLVDAGRRRVSSASLVHNLAAAGLATLGASVLWHDLPHRTPAAQALVLAAAVLVYSLTTTGLDALFGHLAREDGLRLLPSEVGAEVVLASIGVGVAGIWTSDPWRIPFLLTPLVFIHRSQRLPQLEEQAATDPKTGLFNMRRFEEQLTELLAKLMPEGRPVSLIVADLDLLREINNRYGHLAGDSVIQEISEVLRQHTRRGDVAARFGGEEFLLALPGAPASDALRTAERLREAVASRVFSGETPRFATRATVSIGVASAPQDAQTARELVHRADLAVLQAKRLGRNRVVEAANASDLGPAGHVDHLA